MNDFPDFPEEPSRDLLDRQLAIKTARLLSRYKEIEGGYWVVNFKRFLGTVLLTENTAKQGATEGQAQAEPIPHERGESSLPRREADLIDIQVDAAIRKKQVLFSVEELEGERPVTVAIRTAPLDGRRARSSGPPG